MPKSITPKRYITLPPEIDAVLRADGFPPAAQGYDIHDNGWSNHLIELAKANTFTRNVIILAQEELRQGSAFLEVMAQFNKETANLLEFFPGASHVAVMNKSAVNLFHIFGIDMTGVEEGIETIPALPTAPVTAELSLATFYSGAITLGDRLEYPPARRLDYVEKKLPAVWHRFNPRRYQVPQGYGQPKEITLLAAATLISSLVGFKQSNSLTAEDVENSEMHASGPLVYLAMAQLATKNVPIYFLGKQLGEALLRTDLPENFALQDMKWPLPAMAISLPEGLLTDPDGKDVTHLIIAQVAAGTKYQLVPEFKDPGVIAPENAIITVAYAKEGNGDACWHHALNSDPLNIGNVDRFLGTDNKLIDANDPKTQFNNTCRRLAIQILLAMVARPELVETATLARPPKLKGGKEIHPGLWHPNFLGHAYAPKTQHGEDHDPENKKRTHWRRGHFRHYQISRGFAEDKIVWIEPILVNAPQ